VKYAVGIALCGVIYVPSFMKIDTGIEAMLRCCHINLKGCNDGTTDGRDF
jgi:hypothetical protein